MALTVLVAAERDEEVIQPCIEKSCINICVYRLSVLYALVAEIFEVGILFDVIGVWNIGNILIDGINDRELVGIVGRDIPDTVYGIVKVHFKDTGYSVNIFYEFFVIHNPLR